MKQASTRPVLFTLLLGACLAAASATAGPDIVTVTLLRWPYT